MGVGGQHHTPAPFYSRRMNLRYPLGKRLGGLRAGLKAQASRKNLWACRGSNPVVQSVAKHCADSAKPSAAAHTDFDFLLAARWLRSDRLGLYDTCTIADLQATSLYADKYGPSRPLIINLTIAWSLGLDVYQQNSEKENSIHQLIWCKNFEVFSDSNSISTTHIFFCGPYRTQNLKMGTADLTGKYLKRLFPRG